eukprot:CAMPEP_0185845118 /NCGR_PEP_ID=MMETSP1354-20130828/1176_1 /TAXON_ID=708628 /ORGANISM="Erythrolobus madagascarensis, Strain CCMP3276" /LENGTH=438 /DNA_ID=CAMNT_0028545013 /DNA_START=108 /DNA_END=1421 /DNA_ORIENTATION=-
MEEVGTMEMKPPQATAFVLSGGSNGAEALKIPTVCHGFARGLDRNGTCKRAALTSAARVRMGIRDENGTKRKIADAVKSVAAAIAVAGVVAMTTPTVTQSFTEDSVAQVASSVDLGVQERSTIALFQNTKPSVAFVTTYQSARSRISTNIMEIPQGEGSGIVWPSKSGGNIIVTNFHVVRNASSAKILLEDQELLTAELVGADPDKDIAVLKVTPRNGTSLKPIQLGSSASLQVGQSVYAIGNPFGLDHSLSSGIVSGLGREMRSPTGRPITNVIQTDAAINPGNSGGPLLDSSGRLIGMNTSIYSPSGASAGIGFAIPVDTMNQIVDELIRNGRIVRPIIGISYLESVQAQALGVKSGVLVLDVPQGSRAAKAGLRGTSRTGFNTFELGDVITSLDGEKISKEADLFRILEKKKVDQPITLGILRDDQPMSINLKLS